jgi:hypothetical protein
MEFCDELCIKARHADEFDDHGIQQHKRTSDAHRLTEIDTTENVAIPASPKKKMREAR